MTRRLVAAALGVAVFALLIVAIPFSVTLVRAERSRLESGIERDASVIATYVVIDLADDTHRDFQPIAKDYAKRTGGRVVVTDKTGVAVADSDLPGAVVGESFATRPEIATALLGNRTIGHRYSSTLGTKLTYVAVPVAAGGIVYGAVRITYSVSDFNDAVRTRLLALGASVLIALLAAGGVALLVARSITRPLASLATATNALAHGDLGARVPEPNGPEDLQNLAHAFNDMAERIHGLLENQQTFVADASHQLRTPLTALRLRLDQLRDAPDDDEVLDAALEEAARLQRLVEGLLTLARGDGARVTRVPVNAQNLLAERVELWAPLAEERNVHLVSDVDPVWVLARSGALEQVFDNVLDNAIDHAPEGSSVEVVSAPSGLWLEMHVRDHGPGMTDVERQRAFDRFWRGRHPTTGGSGLGLAIVRQLVVSSGGQIRLDETPGGGLDVVVRLQVVPPALITPAR